MIGILKSILCILGCFCLLWGGSHVMAAQSTADVPVTESVLSKARQKVLGSSANTGKNQQEYVVGHGDILGVEVYGEGDMAASAPTVGGRAENAQASDGLRTVGGGVQVRIDGRISLKHVGDVDAVGYTLTQLADYLKEVFSSVYDDPIVTVVLKQSNSRRYTVMGKVAQPGVFYLDYPITLVQVVARSGGFTEWANSEITVVRDNVGEEPQFKGNKLDFDYDDFLAGKKLEKNILIKAGDIIIVH